MENAAEALKMAFAVLVFVIAMTLGFMMISQARATADVVYAITDKQDYVTDISATEVVRDGVGNIISNRRVGLDTVIPTIYRYAQENYAVTLIKGNVIIARFDLQTEDIISSEFPKTSSDSGGTRYQNLINNNSGDSIMGLSEIIKQATGLDVTVDKHLFETLYPVTNSTRPFAPWTSSPYQIMRRLKVDINGGSENFDGRIYKGPNAFSGDGLIKYCKTNSIAQFTEYYYTVKEKNHLTNEEEVKKLEIIYVCP